MELQEFIRTALTEIVGGVAEASEKVSESGAKVGSIKQFGYLKEAKAVYDENDNPISQVEFDIALAEGNSKDTKGGIGVYLGAIGLGTQGASHGESSTHSRIKFSVPITFPAAKA